MPLSSFCDWLETREPHPEEVPDATELSLLIARSGAAGISRDGLARAVGISTETLEDLLAALVSAGQVVELRVNGHRVFRAAM